MASPSPPESPLAAVTHQDPYPYYAELVARRPLSPDASLGLWVAASAKAVAAVLESRQCRVRPLGEPVPPHLHDSVPGALLGRLVRMTDGAGHAAGRRAVVATLASVEPEAARTLSLGWADTLARRTLRHSAQEGLDAFAFQLSVHVLGSLLGLPPERLEETACAVDTFVGALGSPTGLKRGTEAAVFLLELFSRELVAPHGLLARLQKEAQGAGVAEDVVIANAIGFLTQAYEATAGLIGNTVLALSRRPSWSSAFSANRRCGTRRCSRSSGMTGRCRTRAASWPATAVAGLPMREGDVILVLLAAANRDPGANPEPAAFDVFRTARRTFGFGTGAHACPGQALSVAIARAGVERLFAHHLAPGDVVRAVGYRDSRNLRIPRFKEGGEH